MRANRFIRWSAALAALGALALQPNAGFAWTGLDVPPYPIWGKLPVSYSMKVSTFPPAIDATCQQRIVDSFASWSAPACTSFNTLLLGDWPEGTFNMSDGKNVLLWYNKPDVWPSELGDVNSVIGVTLPIWAPDAMGNPIISDADIIFNNIGFCWYDSKAGEPNCVEGKPVDAQSILTHEMGHFLGLGHTDVVGATMQAFYDGGNELATLEQDDVEGVCTLYPIGGSSSGGGNSECDSCRENAAKTQCLSQAKSCGEQCASLCVCLDTCRQLEPAKYDVCATDCSREFPDEINDYLNYTNCICNVCVKPCGTECAGNMAGKQCSFVGTSSSSSGALPEPVLLTGGGGCDCTHSRGERRLGMLAFFALALVRTLRKRKSTARSLLEKRIP